MSRHYAGGTKQRKQQTSKKIEDPPKRNGLGPESSSESEDNLYFFIFFPPTPYGSRQVVDIGQTRRKNMALARSLSRKASCRLPNSAN